MLCGVVRCGVVWCGVVNHFGPLELCPRFRPRILLENESGLIYMGAFVTRELFKNISATHCQMENGINYNTKYYRKKTDEASD